MARQNAVPRKPLRERVLSFLTFFYGPADHRDLPADPRTGTGLPGESVGEGLRRSGEPGRQYARRDAEKKPDDPA